MIRRWLSYLLIVLIAMQSVVAIADEHKSHQEGIQHLEFVHEFDSARTIDDELDQNGGASLPDQYDSHHCCHCHVSGMSLLATSADANGLDVGISVDHLLMRPPFYRSNSASPDIRPPIA